MPKHFGLPRAEKLKSRKQIDSLFATGKAISVFPIRAVYRFEVSGEAGLRIGVSASKKYFKKAVDRNRIKRLLREVYRLQKEEMIRELKAAEKSVNIFFIYTDKGIADFETLHQAMHKCLQRLIKIIKSEILS